MIQFTALINQFQEKGDKTGWTYIEIPADIASQLSPGIKKSFRVKGFLDKFSIEGIGLLPMGEGNFIMALNASIRKGIQKRKGASLEVHLELDVADKPLSSDFIECLEEDPIALEYFYSLTKSHQRYFSNWIDSAKTDQTKSKRIVQAMNALSLKMGYAEMIRAGKGKS